MICISKTLYNVLCTLYSAVMQSVAAPTQRHHLCPLVHKCTHTQTIAFTYTLFCIYFGSRNQDLSQFLSPRHDCYQTCQQKKNNKDCIQIVTNIGTIVHDCVRTYGKQCSEFFVRVCLCDFCLYPKLSQVGFRVVFICARLLVCVCVIWKSFT